MEHAPYLSVVATARNDDHGGNLLARMQVFVDAWINQAKRHNLSSELIVVEWNPPADRARLADALRWPADAGPCCVRIIQVPREVHAQYTYAAALPLYQMIGKNVGIRRARGEFILATNIDIVFSDELVQFLAERRMEKGRMYRIDRHDVMSGVPVDGTLGEQLAYCREHVIRLCARDGVFKLTPDGFRCNEPNDITSAGSGIHFGDGWNCVERWDEQGPFRWIAGEAEILALVPSDGAVMTLEMEAGPGVGQAPQVLQVLNRDESLVAECEIAGHASVNLVLPPTDGREQMIRLRVPGGGRPVLDDLRIQNFRVFRCDWEQSLSGSVPRSYFQAVTQARPVLMRLLRSWRGWRTLHRAVQLLKRRGSDIFGAAMEFWVGAGFHDLERCSAERFRWAGQDAQLFIRTKASRRLALLVEPGPGVAFRPFVLAIRDIDGEVLARAPIRGMTYVEVPVPARVGITTLVFVAEGGGLPAGEDPRTLNFRVFACDGLPAGEAVQAETVTSWRALNAASAPPRMDWNARLAHWHDQIAEMGTQQFLHTNACGDFTLMAREHWHDVRGYAELDRFSIHLDSLLCYAANFAGAREECLRDPMRIYHIEHDVGTGWTPEGQEKLSASIAQKGIPAVSHEDVLAIVTSMRRTHAPILFNLEDWGLAGMALPETTPCVAPSAAGAIR